MQRMSRLLRQRSESPTSSEGRRLMGPGTSRAARSPEPEREEPVVELAAGALRHVPNLDKIREWVVLHYGDYESNTDLTCRATFPRLARWVVDPFADKPVQVMKAAGMVSAGDCAESYYRDCEAGFGEPPHEYAVRLLAAARIQQQICPYSYVTHWSAVIKFLVNVVSIRPGLSDRMFKLIARDFGGLRPYGMFLLADYAQRAFIELQQEEWADSSDDGTEYMSCASV
jgi:hypothetical protein